ncbi:MAG: DNA polymerase II large subunit, partial [Candidatus Korarchaeota archaeon]
ISLKYGIPLHPRYTYAWHDIKIQEYLKLRSWCISSVRDRNVISGALDENIKNILEKLYVPHKIRENRIIIEDAAPLLHCLLLDQEIKPESENVLELINSKSKIKVRAFAPRYIGTRMGRPEKMSIRQMKPPVHVLFPVGDAGGPKRDLIAAARNKKTLSVELCARICQVCKKISWHSKCCSMETKPINICPSCGSSGTERTCPRDGILRLPYTKMEISTEEIKMLKQKYKSVSLVKGVIGLTNRTKTPELLEKGFLRAIYDVYVFRDGTIRFDATDAPLTHFRPKDIQTPVAILRQLGYVRDIYGKPLQRDDQILELLPQDIIIPVECARYIIRIAQFVDAELKEIYGMSPYYNIKSLEDVIGVLVLGLAPHTSAGIVGRVIGFTKSSNIYGHPLWHAAKRRNCDGDEDSIILLLDAFLNFSKEYLPDSPGAKMDAPLVAIFRLNPKEVDDEVYNMDVAWSYPVELYEKGLSGVDYTEIKGLVKTLESQLNCVRGIGFSIPLEISFDLGPKRTTYSTLDTMDAKLSAQLNLAKKINAVNVDTIAIKILRSHLTKDIRGNMRAFGTQKFRCSRCNFTIPVPPLGGTCPQCGGNMVLTVHPSAVLKYLAMIDLLSNVSKNEYILNEVAKIKYQVKQMFRLTQSFLDEWTH